MATVGAVLLCASGCTIFNAPDPGLIGRDGGSADGGMDAGDARVDGSDGTDAGDSGTACVPRQEICGNTEDDDCDGLVDCADFDCAGLSACCTEDVGDVLFTEDWSAADLSLRWSAEPAGAAFPTKSMASGQWRLTSFDEGEAIILNDCTPLSLGLNLSVTFVPRATGSCSVDCYAALYLTQSEYLVTGAELLDDLVVRMESGGALVVEHAGAELGRSEMDFEAETPVNVELGVQPGIDEEGVPQLFATVYATQGGSTQTLVEEKAFIPQEDLISTLPSCDEAPGLFIALAGNGDRVHVGTLEPSRQRCVNPSQFTRPSAESAILTSGHLGLTDWAGPGIGAPTLTSTDAGGDVRWDVMVDATNVDRELEKISHVGMSLGHARSLDWDDPTDWASFVGGPRAGANPPACTDGSCDANVSVREPSLLARPYGGVMATSFVVAYARENTAAIAAGDRDLFDIHAQFISPNVTVAFDASDGAAVLASDVPECDSLRDPELIPAGSSPTDGYWVLFTCESSGPDTIRAIRLSDPLLEPMGDSVLVLGPGHVEPYGAGGVSGPAVVAEYEDGGPGAVFRMWFLARDRGGANVTLAMAQAQTDDITEEMGLPGFEPYSANPILHAQALEGCSAGECDLTGVAVTRRADATTTLRFLVARHVNDAGGSQYELIPLEQFWRSPWM